MGSSGGFCFTVNGWLQGYGSRCVKPPIIYGDMERSRPMTLQWIARMDADVISIEASRSPMELLQAFEVFGCPNDIGPGVYDIYGPWVPPAAKMVERLWFNSVSGLKTRVWPEILASLQSKVVAAAEL